MINLEKLKLHGPWEQVKNMMKRRYVHLTDDDLKYEEGKEHDLLTRLEIKTGENKEEIRKIIESYHVKNHGAVKDVV